MQCWEIYKRGGIGNSESSIMFISSESVFSENLQKALSNSSSEI